METLYLIQAAEKSSQKRDQPWWKEKEQPKRPPARDRRESGKSQQPGKKLPGKKQLPKGLGRKEFMGKGEKRSELGEGQRKRKAVAMEDEDGRKGMDSRKQAKRECGPGIE